MNVPKEESEKLGLSNDDYLFVPSAMKAKWYHMVKWQEMPMTWNRMPDQLRNEIRQSGLEVPPEIHLSPQPTFYHQEQEASAVPWSGLSVAAGISSITNFSVSQ
jgi:hypothetical protein